MIRLPKELKRDANGFTRGDRIARADSYLAEARRMVETTEDAANGAIPKRFAVYRHALTCAISAYEEAGLGEMARRCGWLFAGTARVWEWFDDANATEEL